MAKRPKPRTQVLEDRPREMPWTSSRKIRVILKSVPPLLLTSIPDSVDFPVKPQYQVTTASGTVEVYDHDETTLQTDEDRAAWVKYKAQQEEAETTITEITLKTILFEGVEVVDSEAQISLWRKKRKIIGLRTPEDLDEALLLFKETEVVGDEDDMRFILDNVLRLTGVSREQIEAASRTFQGSVESESPNGYGEATDGSEDQEG